ncbi:MAG: Nif3-like dinuclear metal center hexameric protein [Planctomycetes bacterium]|nr:Nif3-like dinuclear metal center hexameric protein [Planctomycetota bacterium]
MPVSVNEVMDLMEVIAPTWMACDNDHVGLHVGDHKAKVKSILVALDATLPVVREARKRKCQMIVTHHPRIYRAMQTIDESTMLGQIVAELIRGKISLYCAHTNLDTAPGGINDILAEMAGIVEPQTLNVTTTDGYVKLAVFIPEGHEEKVREAICDAGAGFIGEYSDCTFRTPGLGTFKGGDSTKPYIGEAGKLEEAEELKLETIFPASQKKAIIDAMIEAHPYEEVAYDLYPLTGGKTYGLGRYGMLKAETTLKALAAKMKKATASPGTLVLGDPAKKIRKIAVWSGGGCPAAKVASLGVDAVVLGETGYHDTEIFETADVGCIALGHAPCEEIVLEWLAENLRTGLDGIKVEIASGGTPKMWSM